MAGVQKDLRLDLSGRADCARAALPSGDKRLPVADPELVEGNHQPSGYEDLNAFGSNFI